VRRRRHDRGRVDRGALAPLLAPARQLADHVGIELARQPWNFVLAPAFRAVTSGAGGNVGFRQPFVVDPLAHRDRAPRRAAERRRIEMMELVGQG